MNITETYNIMQEALRHIIINSYGCKCEPDRDCAQCIAIEALNKIKEK